MSDRMARDPNCGCPIEDSMTLHGYYGPCSYLQQQQEQADPRYQCEADGQPYWGDYGGEGLCWCGTVVYPLGGPEVVDDAT